MKESELMQDCNKSKWFNKNLQNLEPKLTKSIKKLKILLFSAKKVNNIEIMLEFEENGGLHDVFLNKHAVS